MTRNCQRKPACELAGYKLLLQKSLPRTTHTHTHTERIAVAGPLKLSVKQEKRTDTERKEASNHDTDYSSSTVRNTVTRGSEQHCSAQMNDHAECIIPGDWGRLGSGPGCWP